MKRCLYTLFLLFCVPSMVWEQGQRQESFFFVQLTDPQWEPCPEGSDSCCTQNPMRTLIETINLLEPEFVVISGNLVQNADSEDQKESFEILCEAIDSDIPLYVIPGNHDVGDKATPEATEDFIRRYGSDRFVWKKKDCCVIGFNTSEIRSGDSQREATEYQWVDEQLSKCRKCKHVVLVGHYPFFVSSPDEPDSCDNIPLAVRRKYLDMFCRHGVDVLLSGHLHRCNQTYYEYLRMVTSAASGYTSDEHKPGMMIVTVLPEIVHTAFYEIDHLPRSVNLFGR